MASSIDYLLGRLPRKSQFNAEIDWTASAAQRTDAVISIVTDAYKNLSAECSTINQSQYSSTVPYFCGDRKGAVLALVGAALPSPETAQAWRVALAYFMAQESNASTLYEVMAALRKRLLQQPALWGTFPESFLGLYPAPFGPPSYGFERHPNPMAAVIGAIAFKYGPKFPAGSSDNARLAALNLMQDMVNVGPRLGMTMADLTRIVRLAEGSLLDPTEIDMWPYGRQIMNAISALSRSVLAQSQISVATTTGPSAPPPPPPKLPPTWLQGNKAFLLAAGLGIAVLGGAFWLTKDRIAARL